MLAVPVVYYVATCQDLRYVTAAVKAISCFRDPPSPHLYIALELTRSGLMQLLGRC